MKAHGKGPALSINEPNRGGVNIVNDFKMKIEAQTAAPPRIREFKPLKVAPHPRQREIDEYRAWPSRYAI